MCTCTLASLFTRPRTSSPITGHLSLNLRQAVLWLTGETTPCRVGAARERRALVPSGAHNERRVSANRLDAPDACLWLNCHDRPETRKGVSSKRADSRSIGSDADIPYCSGMSCALLGQSIEKMPRSSARCEALSATLNRFRMNLPSYGTDERRANKGLVGSRFSFRKSPGRCLCRKMSCDKPRRLPDSGRHFPANTTPPSCV